MSQTIWSLVPPLITIALALYTKEVYISLIVGILTGALMFCDFNFISAIDTMFTIMESKVGGNVNILVFLVDGEIWAQTLVALSVCFCLKWQSEPMRCCHTNAFLMKTNTVRHCDNRVAVYAVIPAQIRAIEHIGYTIAVKQ